MKHLFWLTLLGFVGFVKFVVPAPMLGAFFAFFAFTVFYKADERDQANLGKAALFSFVVTLIGFVGVFAYVGWIRHASGLSRVDALQMMVLGLAIVYGVMVASFALSHIYFERPWEDMAD